MYCTVCENKQVKIHLYLYQDKLGFTRNKDVQYHFLFLKFELKILSLEEYISNG